jgi:hypothetical protein
MIADPAALMVQRQAWTSVRDTQERLQSTLAFTFASGGIIGSAVFDACNDLTLVFSYAVLQDILEQLEYEKHFKRKGPGLGGLMQASRLVLPWQDFALVDKGRDRRNAFAHDRTTVPVQECVGYIDAIERELRAWGIVT